jgi:hypothetical protein
MVFAVALSGTDDKEKRAASRIAEAAHHPLMIAEFWAV